ncbi:MAG: hypothetical protein WC359_13580 [Dehalococcoidia bacterium]
MSSRVIPMGNADKDGLAELRPILGNILDAVREYHGDTQCKVQKIAEDVARLQQSDCATTGRLDRTREDLIDLKESLDERDKDLRNMVTVAIAQLEAKLSGKADAAVVSDHGKKIDEKVDSKSIGTWLAITGTIIGLISFALGYVIHP